MTTLAIHDLQFSWQPDESPVLQIDHLQVAPNGQLFISGPSGVGKTTLLNLIAGVLVAQQGSIHILGRALAQQSNSSRDQIRADHIGFIFQLFNLISYLSVLDNVMLPCRFSQRRRQRAAQAGSLQAEAQRLLHRLGLEDELLSRPVTALSVGQQQRVAAARALIGQPELLIADEPTSALDEQNRDAFLHLLLDECDRANTALIMVSHDCNLADLFEHHLAL